MMIVVMQMSRKIKATTKPAMMILLLTSSLTSMTIATILAMMVPVPKMVVMTKIDTRISGFRFGQNDDG